MKTEKQAHDESNRLSAKLKELRLSHGYRQEDIAAAIDIKQATYSNYELGRRMPGTRVIYKIANFYGFPADDLLKLVIRLDDDIYFDAPQPSAAMHAEDEFLKYMNEDDKPLSRQEKELLYHFKRLTKDDRQEVIEFARFKRQNERKRLSKNPN